MKIVIPSILALALLFCLPGVLSTSAKAYIDNSDLTPPYRPQEEVV